MNTYRTRSLSGVFLVITTVALAVRLAVADDAIQIINSAWEWPDQGLGLWDPNGDAAGGAIVWDMTTHQSNLVVGGSFNYAGGGSVFNNAVMWDNSQWHVLGPAPGGFNAVVRTLLSVENDLYVGGGFFFVGGVEARGVARWDGKQWHGLAVGPGTTVTALDAFDDGTGNAVYAGGSFPQKLRKWDGLSWAVVGGGCSGAVVAMTIFDDGSGPALFIAGPSFCGGTVPGRVLKWDGTCPAAC